MKKLHAIFLSIAFGFNAYSAIQLTWSNTAGTIYNSNGSTPLFGTNFFAPYNSATAYFVQLIKGTPLAIDLTNAQAVTSGNQVIDSRFMGDGIFFDSGSGRIDVTSNYAALNTGDTVFVRFWNAASPNFSLGLAPTPFNSGTSTHYGNSSTFIINDGGTGIASFSIPSTSTLLAIPEPGTLATIAGGLAVVVFGLRRRRYRI